MSKADNKAFWKSYNERRVFMCSNCGFTGTAAADTCPKCKRDMVNSAVKKQPK